MEAREVRRGRDVRIDVVRVLAMVFVLLHHADDYGIEFMRATPLLARIDDALTWVALGSLFAVSGFLAARATTTPRPAGQRIARRLARLYPPFVIALVVNTVTGAVYIKPGSFGTNLVLLGPWIGPNVGTLWFVEVLIGYHVLLELWGAFSATRSRTWTLPVTLGAVALAAASLATATGGRVDPRVFTYLPAFVLGAVLGVRSGSAWTPRTASGPDGGAARALHWLAGGSYMTYLVHRLVFHTAADVAAPLGVVGVTAAVLACVPVVLAVGQPLQRGYDRMVGALGQAGRNRGSARRPIR